MRGRRGIAAAADGIRHGTARRTSSEAHAESAHVLAAEAFAETLVSAAEKAKAEYAKAVQEVTVPTEPVCEAEVPSMPMPIEANSTPDQQPLLSMKVTEHASGDAAKPKHADELMIEFARSMSTLARDGPMKRTGIREAGGIPPLVKLLFSKRCCSMAVEALSWLAMEKRAAHIIDAGGIHRLTRLCCIVVGMLQSMQPVLWATSLYIAKTIEMLFVKRVFRPSYPYWPPEPIREPQIMRPLHCATCLARRME